VTLIDARKLVIEALVEERQLLEEAGIPPSYREDVSLMQELCLDDEEILEAVVKLVLADLGVRPD